MEIRNILEAYLPRPKVEYYIERMIRPSSRNMFWAAPGTGKSLAFITMGICIAYPEIDNWLGFEINKKEKLKILFIQEEMDNEGFLEFLEESLRGIFDKEPDELPFDFAVFPGVNFSDEESINKLKVEVITHGYNIIFVDSFAATFSDDENAKKDIQPALDRVKSFLSLPSKPAFIFTHHPTRDKTRFRGSGSIDAALDLMVAIKEKQDNCIEFKMEKNRYKPCISWEAKKIFLKDKCGNDIFRLERTGKLSDIEEQQNLLITIIENNPECSQLELENIFTSLGGKKSSFRGVLKMLDDSEVTEIVSNSIGGRGQKKTRKLTQAYLDERFGDSIAEAISTKGNGYK